MSLFGGIGHFLGSAVKDVGKVAEHAAPLANFIPGVGPVAAGVIGGLGGLAAGDGIKGGITGALGGYLPGVAGLGSAATAGTGLSGVASALGNAVKSPAALGAVSSVLGGGAQPAQGGAGGLLQSLEGFLTGNGGANALGIAQGVNAAQLQQKANNYAKDALGTVQQSYNDRAPLRSAGLQGMLHPQTPSLAPLASIASIGSPYAPKLAPVTPGVSQ